MDGRHFFLFLSSRESITVGALVFASSALAPRSLALARVGGNASVPRPDRTMSVIDRFPHSTAELRRVKAVQFGVLSPDEIVRAPPAPISSRLRADSRNDSLGLPPRARRVPDLS